MKQIEITDESIKRREPKNNFYKECIADRFESCVIEGLIFYIAYNPIRFSHIMNFIKSHCKPTSKLSLWLDKIFAKSFDINEFDRSFQSAEMDILEVGLEILDKSNINSTLSTIHVEIWNYNNGTGLTNKIAPSSNKKSLVICLQQINSCLYNILFKKNNEIIEPHFENINTLYKQKLLENIIKCTLNLENFMQLSPRTRSVIFKKIPKNVCLDQEIEKIVNEDTNEVQEIELDSFKQKIMKPEPIPIIEYVKLPNLKEKFDEITQVLESKNKEFSSVKIQENNLSQALENIPKVKWDCSECRNNPNNNISRILCSCLLCIECCRGMLALDICPRCQKQLDYTRMENVLNILMD